MGDIFLGRLVKAFGIRGELKFHPSDDFWEDVLQSKRLTLRSRGDNGMTRQSVEFRHSRPHGRSYVVEMDGVADRNTAETLVGAEVFIAEDHIDVSLPERWLPYQVIGTTVKTEAGDVLGEITSVIYSSAHDVYEITGERGKFLVPAVSEFVVLMDKDSRTLILRPMPGLIEE